MKAYVNEKSARKIYTSTGYLNCVLVLSVLGGSDYFIDVHCNYKPSSFGSSCYDLVKIFHPIQSLSHPPMDSDPELPVPKELWRLLDFIIETGIDAPGLFSESGTPETIDAVRQAVDSDSFFGPEVDVYSVCRVLLEFLGSLSVPVLPLAVLDLFCNLYISEGRTNPKLAESFIESLPPVAARCFVAVISFLQELLLHKDSNNLSKMKLIGLFSEALTQASRLTKRTKEMTEDEWRALQLRVAHRYCFLSLFLPTAEE